MASQKCHYATGESGEQFVCSCGHVEPITADFSSTVDRMNAHVRAAYTDAEWEKLMSETKLALLDSQTGALKMPEEGPKS